MRAQIAILVAASSVTGCCAGGYPAVVSGANPAPFDAFQAGMKLAVGMPTDVASSSSDRNRSAQAMSCGFLAGNEWTCQLMKFGCCENNQLLVDIRQPRTAAAP